MEDGNELASKRQRMADDGSPGPATPSTSSASHNESFPRSESDGEWTDAENSSDMDDVNDEEEKEGSVASKPEDSGRGRQKNVRRKRTRDVSPMSIHRINFSIFKDNSFLAGSTGLDQASKIMDLIVNKRGYKLIAVAKAPEMRKKDKELFPDEEPFKLKVYARTTKKRNTTMRAMTKKLKTAAKHGSQSAHEIYFFCRKDEIFALTRGAAWMDVRESSESEFPIAISKRILDRDGTLSSSCKYLYGPITKSKQSTKKIQELNPYKKYLCYITDFTTKTALRSSIYRLQCFQKASFDDGENESNANCTANTVAALRYIDGSKPSTSKNTKRLRAGNIQPKVNVTQTSITIQRKFFAEDITAILNHLSLIARGTKTKDMDGKEEIDSTAHDQLLHLADSHMAKKLDLKLADLIRDAVFDEKNVTHLSGFEFVPKAVEQYYQADEYKLQTPAEKAQLPKKRKQTETQKEKETEPEKSVKKWTEPPSTEEVIRALRNVPSLKKDKWTGRQVNPGDYLKLLMKFKLCFTKLDRETPKPVPQMIQGMLVENSDVYWHVGKDWYFVQPSYFLQVQKDFQKVLVHFKPCQESGLMDMKSSLEEYLDVFRKKEHFYCRKPHTSNSTISCNDLVDMIRVDEDRNLTLYFFMKSPKTSECINEADKIMENLLHLKKAEHSSSSDSSRSSQKNVGGSERNLQSLINMHGACCENSFFKLKFPRFETFKDKALNAKVVIVVCKGADGDFSLKKEKEKKSEHDILKTRPRVDTILLKSQLISIFETSLYTKVLTEV